MFPVELKPFGRFLGRGIPIAVEVDDIKMGVPWIVGEPDRPQPGPNRRRPLLLGRQAAICATGWT